jgi:hypothetical protein
MELLKFSDSPKSSRRGKNPAAFIGAGIMVAVMGLSSTLAGTISINSGATVEFGQGIVSTAACDASISIAPVSTYVYAADTAGAFEVTSITIDKVGWDSGVSGATTSQGRGCRGQVLELRAFGTSSTNPLAFYNSSESNTVGEVLTIYIPETSVSGESLTAGTNFVKKAYDYNDVTGAVGTTADFSPTLTASGNMANADATSDGMRITIGGLRLSAAVTKFTLESRSPRADSSEKTP